MSNKQQAVVTLIASLYETIVEVSESGGAPGGHLYAALMSTGITLDAFNAVMGIMTRVGMVVKRGECYIACDPATKQPIG